MANSEDRNINFKVYCGTCLRQFQSLCDMHYHMKEHNSEGSYFFDNTLKTAYPKNETTCSYSQTESVDTQKTGIVDTEMISKSDVQACEGNILAVLGKQITRLKKKARKKHGFDHTRVDKTVSEAYSNKSGSGLNCYVKLEKIDEELTKRSLKQEKRDGGAKAGMQEDSKVEFALTAYIQGDNIADESPETESFDNAYFDCNDLGCFNSSLSNSGVENNANIDIRSNNNESLSGDLKSETDETRNYISPYHESLNVQQSLSGEVKIEDDCTSAIAIEDLKQDVITHSYSATNMESASSSSQLEIKYNKSKRKRNKAKKVDNLSKKVRKETVSLMNVSSNIESSTLTKKVRKKEIGEFIICDVCGLTVSRRQYKYHELKHTGERPYLCSHCGRSFTARKHLVTHLFQHQTVKPHSCSVCGKGFAERNALQQHMNIHSDIKPHSCDRCGKTFSHVSNLKFHIKSVHLNERNHECQTCKQKFKKKSHLVIHMLSHSTASFECSVCLKKFQTPKSLKRHSEIHNKTLFKCAECNKKFPVLQYVYLHMQRCHAIQATKAKELWNSGTIEVFQLNEIKTEKTEKETAKI